MAYISQWALSPLFENSREEVDNWVLDHACSAGTQGRNVPYREDIGESAIKTTVSSSKQLSFGATPPEIGRQQ